MRLGNVVCRGIAVVLCVALLVAFPFLPKASVFYRADEIKDSPYKCVLTLWHIETFEGGSTSRLDYLERVSQNLEKRERNLFVYVRQMDVETLNNQLALGIVPDIISFGQGLGGTLKPFLQPLSDSFEVLSGYYHGSAVGYLAGGYVLMGDTEMLKTAGVEGQPLLSLVNHPFMLKGKTVTSLSVGRTAHINPLLALQNLGINAQSVAEFSQYNAYENYILKRSVMLLGTTRDVNRILHRESLGRGRAMQFEYLSYTNLVQYIGIVTSNPQRRASADLFLTQLFSKSSIDMVAGTGMFSTTNAKLYYTGYLNDMEDVLQGENRVVEKLW